MNSIALQCQPKSFILSNGMPIKNPIESDSVQHGGDGHRTKGTNVELEPRVTLASLLYRGFVCALCLTF